MIDIKKVIAFTGHRDKNANNDDLDKIAEQFGTSDILWVHGDAPGFDKQVDEYAKEHSIPVKSVRPDYKSHGRYAPLIRDRKIVDMCDVLVACYDGRIMGGTFYTLGYAKKQGKQIIEIPPAKRVRSYR